MITRKAIIHKLTFPIEQYNYNVQIWISVDGGKTHAYCGLGKYFKTEPEARKYAANINKEES